MSFKISPPLFQFLLTLFVFLCLLDVTQAKPKNIGTPKVSKEALTIEEWMAASAAPASPPATPVIGIVLGAQTGTAPFDADNNPGHDASANNNTVRTLDNVIYNFDYNVNGGDATNVTFTMTLPAAIQWTTLPAVCLTFGVTPTSSIVGQTLTCNIGNVSSGTTGTFSATTLVSSVSNGTALAVTASVSADSVAPISSNPITTNVSAAPAYNLRKVGATIIGSRNGSDGVTKGQLITYGIQVLTTGTNFRGQEQLANTITLTDSLSAISPNAKLYNWDVTLPGCGPVNNVSGLNTLSPYGKIGIAPAATSDNSVIDSGSFTCAQTGSAVNVTINNANTTGASFPSKQKNGTTTIPSTEKIFISGYIAVWVPISDIGAGINTTNTITNFDPNSISGQSNFGSSGEQDTTDNAKAFFIPGAVGGFSTHIWQIPTNQTKLPTQTGTASGDALVAPNQVFGARYTFNNQGVVPLSNVIVCGKINNTKNVVNNIFGQSAPVNVAISTGVSYTVEYAGGAYASDNAAAIGTCGTFGDSTGWSTDPNSIGLTNITKVRIRVASLQPTEFIRLNVGYKALPGTVGTRIGVYGAYRADELCGGGAWRYGRGGSNGACTNTVIYDPATHASSVGDTGDRVTLANAVVRIAKTAAAPNMVAGNTMLFTLTPTISNPEGTSAGSATSVTITDTLPASLTYNTGSASGGPTGTAQPNVTVNGDGTTTLVWNLGTQPVNTTVPPLTFTATAPFNTPNNTNATNSVVIACPDDASDATIRTATATVIIGNPGAFVVNKSTSTPTPNANGNVIYTLTYGNVSNTPFAGTDIIDVLPWNGDSRSPATSFHGTMSLQSVGVSNGETIQYTKATADTIYNDPNDFSNQSGGTTLWCNGYNLGGSCPASLAEVTAIRIIGGTLPVGATGRNIVVSLSTSGNQGGNVYSNNFGGRAQGLALPVSSNTVSATVVGVPFVVLVKSCPSPADCTSASQSPGTDLTYKIVFTNTGSALAQKFVLTDPVPNFTDYKIGSETINLGTTGLTVSMEFSNDYNAATPAAATWGYTPVSAGGGASAGYDRNVKAVRWRVTLGNLSSFAPNNTGEAGFTVKIR